MESKKKVALTNRSLVYIVTSVALAGVTFVLSGSLYVSLIIGVAYFLYSLSAIYMHYQEINRDSDEDNDS
jgi:uncharacterized membrane protein